MGRQRSPPDASPSPPAQPLTKRDVRRQRISDKLSGMIRSFDSNQQAHYQMQMRAVQADMNLVLRADLHAAGSSGEDGALLEDGGDGIRRMVEEASGGVVAAIGDDEGLQRDYWNLAGSRYREFAREVNDCVEQRDADLVALHNGYMASTAELERLTQQKLHQAEQEHQALASTIRQRLITSLTKKRQQLLRDKEQLDIAADNPLLLHPNHFHINVPGSPGNGAANRKTRHLRHRAGSPAPGDLDGNGGKKKRKFGAVEDDGNESPAPNMYKPLGPPPDNLGGGRSPFKDAREKHAYTQFEAPAYSLERIFTEKELALASDTARMATYKHFNQPPEPEKAGSNTNGTAVPSIDGELPDAAPTNEADEAHTTTEAGPNGTPPPSQPPAAAPEMERSTSQAFTRATANKDPTFALLHLANVASAANGNRAATARDKDPFAPVLPNYHAVMRSEKSGAPTPAGVSGLELESDLRMMRSLGPSTSSNDASTDVADQMMREAYGESHGREDEHALRRRLLDQALSTPSSSATTVPPYRIPLIESGPAQIGKGVERLAATGFAPVSDYLASKAKTAAAAGGVVGPTSAAAMLGGEGVNGGAMAAALRGQLGGGVGGVGGEAMSRGSSAQGSEVEGEGGGLAVGVGVGTRGRGRGRLV